MTTFLVTFEKTFTQVDDHKQKLMYRETTTEEVEAAAYIPLPQKVVNFYKKKSGVQTSEEIIATYYEVVSVKVKK